jgi:hypothetical protein
MKNPVVIAVILQPLTRLDFRGAGFQPVIHSKCDRLEACPTLNLHG